MNNLKLRVQGMHCEGCENRIKKSLSEISNIKEVIANHENGEVIINYDGEIILNEIKEIIDDLGFEVIE